MTQIRSALRPAKNQDFTDRNQRIYDFLWENPVGVLSSVTPNGDPHGVVIYFNIDHDFTITFLTRRLTRKYDNITRHKHVTLTVFDPNTQAVSQIIGMAEEILDPQEINEVANKMLRANFRTSEVALPPVTKLEAGEHVAFRIYPVQIRMAVYARPETGGYADLFESIESFDFEDPAK